MSFSSTPDPEPHVSYAGFQVFMTTMDDEIRACMEQETKLTGQMTENMDTELDKKLMQMLEETKSRKEMMQNTKSNVMKDFICTLFVHNFVCVTLHNCINELLANN